MREVESVRCRMAALSHRMIAEVESRHLWERAGAKGMRGYVIDVLRLSAAGARVRASASLRPRSFCGEPGPSLLPTTAALQAEGTVSPEHARVIMRVINRNPPTPCPPRRGPRPSSSSRTRRARCRRST
ncbi:DUF222 domain-containing protein [Nocardia otitidiscaviarum]|uniref:DUF222 domain-containing protein n=1 Tax=Nocardia otitidiscaviarum TaxID=1823 RepID=UPI0034DD85E4